MNKYIIAVFALIFLSVPVNAKEWEPWGIPDYKPNSRRNYEQPKQDNIWTIIPDLLKSKKKQSNNRPDIVPVVPSKIKIESNFNVGDVVIDVGAKKLYYIIDSISAYEYPIAVGKDGFEWEGTETISNITYWPAWNPPKDMLKRRPDLPDHMDGGINNPLGAVAMYLGNSLYRIHGTNEPKSIGKAVSSGCFRMLNGHAVHLASLVKIGTTVRVLKSIPGEPPSTKEGKKA